MKTSGTIWPVVCQKYHKCPLARIEDNPNCDAATEAKSIAPAESAARIMIWVTAAERRRPAALRRR
jgi:hypothetical protein